MSFPEPMPIRPSDAGPEERPELEWDDLLYEAREYINLALIAENAAQFNLNIQLAHGYLDRAKDAYCGPRRLGPIEAKVRKFKERTL